MIAYRRQEARRKIAMRRMDFRNIESGLIRTPGSRCKILDNLSDLSRGHFNRKQPALAHGFCRRCDYLPGLFATLAVTVIKRTVPMLRPLHSSLSGCMGKLYC